MAITPKTHKTREIFSFLFHTYPRRCLSVVLLLVTAGLFEGLGLMSILPLISAVTNESPSDASGLSSFLFGLLESIGLQPAIGPLLVCVVIGIALKSTFVALGLRQAGTAAAELAADLRLGLIRALMSARWGHFVEQPSGRLANAVSSEAMRGGQVVMRVGYLVAGTVQVVIYGSLAFLVSWYVTLGAFVVGLVMIGALNFLVRRARRAGEEHTRVLTSLLRRLLDGLSSIKPLKAMGREDTLQPLLEKETNELKAVQRQQATLTAALPAFQEAFMTACLAVGMYFATVQLDIGFRKLAFMAFLFQRTMVRISDLQSHYQQLVDVESALWSIQHATSEAVEARERPRGSTVPTLDSRIRFDEVTFGYDENVVLDDVSFDIPARRFTAISGPSGSGKTTIVDLLTGLLEPDSGTIRVDEDPLSTCDVAAWRARIGYVPQEVVLFHDSIFVNVGLQGPEIEVADVEEALKAAEAWDFIAPLPNGLETTVGERGLKFSGGQRQRIALARALVRRPEILILDEATTGLDPATERSICETLQRLTKTLTVVAVSHQPAVVEAADHVVDLQMIAATEGTRNDPASKPIPRT